MNQPVLQTSSSTTEEAFEDLADLDLPQQTWPQTGRSDVRRFDVILPKSTAAILAAALFVGYRTTASTSLAGAAAVNEPVCTCLCCSVRLPSGGLGRS